MPVILFFPFFGPNRHSDKRVIELRLDFGQDDGSSFSDQLFDLRKLLCDNGVLDEAEKFPGQDLPVDRISSYSSLLAQTILLFQRKNNQRVDYFSVSTDQHKQTCVALVEHEHSDVGMAAAKLAIKVFTDKLTSFTEAWRQFSDFTYAHHLPLETEAIIKAARQRDIPFLQLERAPLTGCIDTGYRVRDNGLLSLGHGVGSQMLDGTFCLGRAGDFHKALLRNPPQRADLMRKLDVPLFKPSSRDEADSSRFWLLALNRKVTAMTGMVDGGRQIVDDVHDSLVEHTLAISEKLGFAPVSVMFQASDISVPLTLSSGGAIDFDLAPDLSDLPGACKSGEDLLACAADDLLDWLFPDPATARIPLVAVTGTNGKTTTSRMLRHIFKYAGFRPGLVCTDGIFLDQKQVSDEDNGTFVGHARVLTSRQVNAAVLETHHRGLAIHGFAFEHCNVAVCLNVTEEHLAVGEIETVEEMAVIKRALVERASQAAVLFADDPFCLEMIKYTNSKKVCLISMRSGVEQLSKHVGTRLASFCVLEPVKGADWIIFYDEGQRFPVMPVSHIPATFNGTARVNVSNAMHAISAGYHAGLDLVAIKSALSVFRAGQELTPGRMNVFDGLPFRIIMDFAHNPDGIQKFCEFADCQTPPGRKLVAFAGLSKRTDDNNRKIARAIAGHFDFYFCKDYEPSKPPKLRMTGPFMQQVLLEEGVPEHLTTVRTFGRDVIFDIFDHCQQGDLLFLLVGHSETKKVPGYIREYMQLNTAGKAFGAQPGQHKPG